MIYSIKEWRLPHIHVRAEETPLSLCEGPDLSFWQVDEELVFAGAVVGHPLFFATFDRDRILAISTGWNHTVPCPRRSPRRFVVFRPPVEKISSALSDFLIFFRKSDRALAIFLQEDEKLQTSY